MDNDCRLVIDYKQYCLKELDEIFGKIQGVETEIR